LETEILVHPNYFETASLALPNTQWLNAGTSGEKRAVEVIIEPRAADPAKLVERRR
jgi:hypothetical protein